MWSLPSPAQILHKNPLLEGNQVFYRLCVHFINLSWRRRPHQRGLIWIPFKLVHTSSLRGFVVNVSQPLLLPLCVSSSHLSSVSLSRWPGPGSDHTSGWHHLSWSYITSWAWVTQGWLGSHSYAHSSSALCMRWQDSQAQAVSPQSVCPDLPLLNATRVIWMSWKLPK